MRLRGVLWKERFVHKIVHKHGVSTEEAEDVVFGSRLVRRAERGRIKGEDLYAPYGRTRAGRYVVVFFIRKRRGLAMPITARPMTQAERRYYLGHKKNS